MSGAPVPGPYGHYIGCPYTSGKECTCAARDAQPRADPRDPKCGDCGHGGSEHTGTVLSKSRAACMHGWTLSATNRETDECPCLGLRWDGRTYMEPTTRPDIATEQRAAWVCPAEAAIFERGGFVPSGTVTAGGSCGCGSPPCTSPTKAPPTPAAALAIALPSLRRLGETSGRTRAEWSCGCSLEENRCGLPQCCRARPPLPDAAAASPASLLGEAVELLRRASDMLGRAVQGLPGCHVAEMAQGAASNALTWTQDAQREAQAREAPLAPAYGGMPQNVGNPCWQCDRPLGSTMGCITCEAKRREGTP